MRHAPTLVFSITSLRLAAAGGLIAHALGTAHPWGFAALLTLGVLSDILDGVVARRLVVNSARLRRYDSAVDVVFWLAALAAVLIVRPGLIVEYRAGFAVLLTLELACQTVSWARFRRPPATHTLGAKLWGLSLFAALLAVLCFDTHHGWLDAMFVIGVVANLEVLAILAASPRQPVDVLTIGRLWRPRRAV